MKNQNNMIPPRDHSNLLLNEPSVEIFLSDQRIQIAILEKFNEIAENIEEEFNKGSWGSIQEQNENFSKEIEIMIKRTG